MNFKDQIEQIFSSVQEKDEEIKKLKEENDRLRQEVEKFRQNKHPDHLASGHIRVKAAELRKVIDDFLTDHNRTQKNHSYPPISIDANKASTSMNENSKASNRPVSDELPIHSPFLHQEDFSASRPELDPESVNATEPIRHYHHVTPHNGHNSHNGHNNTHHGALNLPTAVTHINHTNHTPQKRFTQNNMNGMNNNNNNRRNNHNNNNNNNNNKQNHHTIWVSWPGSATLEQLQELFNSIGIDVADIRYTNQKQFAHIDLKSDEAVQKAMQLNGQIKNKDQGALRVEQGKPRSSNNNAENGQRSQNQNKNFNRPNNKNVNGYNNLQQKHNKYNHNNHNNHNNQNHGGQYPGKFTTPDEKENGINGINSISWYPPQEHAKQNGDSA